MRVLFLQQQPCIRTLKEAAGLRAVVRPPGDPAGFACRGRSLTGFYGTGDELFDRWWQLGSDPLAALRGAIADFKPDLVHSHNLPDELTVLALEVTDGRIPVVTTCTTSRACARRPMRTASVSPTIHSLSSSSRSRAALRC